MDLGAFSHLSVRYFAEDWIGAAPSMEIVLGIPFMSIVIVCDDTSMIR